MQPGARKPPSAVGFLTVVENSQHGLMGGYLVLNVAGRPLEFHCTTPIKPNRAQQILYGPTLEPFLYGEQIGQALVSKSAFVPLAIFTDRQPALAVRTAVDVPVALVLPPEAEIDAAMQSGGETTGETSVPTFRIDGPHAVAQPSGLFMFGRNRLSVSPQRQDDRALIEQRLSELDQSFNLAEPFERVREAIEEAQRVGR
jgi:hypothetical protein